MTTTYTGKQLKHEAISAIRQYGRQRKCRVRLVDWSLEIAQDETGKLDPPTLLAHGWTGNKQVTNGEAFTVRVAI